MIATLVTDKDYTTHNFLQWYVAEQIEEEALAKLVIIYIALQTLLVSQNI